METIIIYLLKSAGLASIFILGYLFLLKNDTAFRHNRIFLVSGIFASFILPALEFTRKVTIEAAATTPLNFDVSTSTAGATTSSPIVTDWWQVAGSLYFIVLSLLFIKFIFQFFNVFRAISGLPKKRKNGFTYCSTSEDIKPFSFFRYIIFNPNLHSSKELEMILTHEEAHARQWHSLDVLLVQLFTFLLWFNPLSWIYKRNLIRNLEYLADKEVAENTTSTKEYQKTLLKVTVGGFYPALTNPFYQSFLKKRIMMLNKNSSEKSPFWKVSLVLPFVFLFLITFNMKTVAQVQERELAHVSYSYDSGKHLAIITKDAKTEELEKLKKDLAENGVILDFTEVKRSAEGIITSIALSYKDVKTGNSGSYNQNESEGIAGIAITIDEGKVSIKSSSQSSSPKHERGSAVLSKIGEKPLIVIAGKEYKKEDLNGKYIWIKNGLLVLTASEASKKYGDKAKDGVIFMSEGEILADKDAHLEEIDKENKNVSREYFWIIEDQAPLFVTLEKREDGKPNAEEIIPDAEEIIAIEYDDNNTKINTQATRPLIVVEGELMEEDFEMNSLDVNKIKAVTILKDENAIKKYGERGKNGVIEIDLKSKEELENPSKGVGKSQEDNGDKKPVIFTATKVKFDESDSKKGTSLSITGVGSAEFDNTGSLYVINGKEMDKDFDANTISAESIETINVIKGQKAIDKYGQKAKEGVIEITTKE